MRILIHGINYAPELIGIGKYSAEMAQWLALQGHDVRVVTAPPYYPQWRLGEGFSNCYSRVKEAGVLVWRCPLYVPEKPSGLTRILHLASFAMSSLPLMLAQVAWRPQIVLSIEPPVLCAPQAWLTARLSDGKAWLHIQDFEIDAAFGLGIVRSPRLRGIVSAIDRWINRRFDRVSTISHSMRQRLLDKGVSEERATFFPNWIDTDLIRPDREAGLAFKRSLGIEDDRPVVLYSGNLGFKQGLDIIIEAARALQDQAAQFLICGDGAARPHLVERAAGLSNVRFIPLQPLEQLNGLLNAADIHLLPQRADAADLVMPSKLGGILSCGGAVVATALEGTEVGRTVQEAGGRLTPPEDAPRFTQAICELLENAPQLDAMKLKARAYAERHLSKQMVLQRLVDDMSRLLHRG